MLATSRATLFAALIASSCRPISFCRSDGKDCAAAEARAHPAGEGGEAGQAGGASNPTIDCEFPLANCDESTLTGCEANVLQSPRHCGGCGKPCDGFCGEGRCFPFETISTIPISKAAGIAPATEHVYFVSRQLNGGTNILERISKRTGEIDTVLEGAPVDRIEALHIGLERLYFGDSGGIYSIGFAGLGLREELKGDGFSTPLFTTTRDWLYWLGGAGLLRRPLNSIAAPVGMQLEATDVSLCGYPRELTVATTSYPESGSSYRAGVVTWPAVQWLAAGSGRILRLRTALSGVYILVEAESSGAPDTTQLYFVESDSTYASLLASGIDFKDFAIDDYLGVIYVIFSDEYKSGVRVISHDLGLRLELWSRAPIEQLEVSLGVMWFFNPDPVEPSRSLLTRLDAAQLFEEP